MLSCKLRSGQSVPLKLIQQLFVSHPCGILAVNGDSVCVHQPDFTMPKAQSKGGNEINTHDLGQLRQTQASKGACLAQARPIHETVWKLG